MQQQETPFIDFILTRFGHSIHRKLTKAYAEEKDCSFTSAHIKVDRLLSGLVYFLEDQ